MTVQKAQYNDPNTLMEPSGDIVTITPSDSVEFEHFTKAIIMSTGNDGTLSAVDKEGKTVTIPVGTLTTGAIYPFQLSKINNTGTTATDVVCLF